MALNIISNFAANVAQRNLTASDAAATSSLAKLSAGTRVLSAKDDAASLAVGSRLQAEVTGLKQAAVNAGQAISMLQIADGAMAKVNDILIRMKTLAVQSGSGQISSTERNMLDTEYQALLSEVDRIAEATEFAGTALVNGSIDVNRTSASDFQLSDGVENIVFRGNHDVADGTGTNVTIAYNTSNGFTVTNGGTAYSGAIASDAHDGTNMSTGHVVTLTSDQAGDNATVDIILSTAFVTNATASDGTLTLTGSNSTSFNFKVGTGTTATKDEIAVTVNSISASALSMGGTDITTVSQANAASTAISNAIDDIQTARATVGANQNRLEFAAANIATTTENTEAARSQLMDLDVAAEMSNFVSKQILVQAGVSMLAQANQLPNNLLRLFQ
jgi:flagellin